MVEGPLPVAPGPVMPVGARGLLPSEIWTLGRGGDLTWSSEAMQLRWENFVSSSYFRPALGLNECPIRGLFWPRQKEGLCAPVLGVLTQLQKTPRRS